MQGIPAIAGGTKGEDTERCGVDSLDGFHDGKNVDLPGIAGEGKAAGWSLVGADEPFAGELLQELGEKMAGQAGIIRDLASHHETARFLLC